MAEEQVEIQSKGPTYWILFAVGLLIAVCAVMGVLYLLAISVLPDASAKMTAGVIAVSGTAIFSFLAKTWVKHLENQREVALNKRQHEQSLELNREQHRQDVAIERRNNRLHAYQQIAALYFHIFAGINDDIDTDDDQLSEEIGNRFGEATSLLVIWGSDEFVHRWGDIFSKTVRGEYADDVEKQLEDFEDLLRQIRKEVGYEPDALDRGALLRMFVTDAEEFRPDPEPPSTQLPDPFDVEKASSRLPHDE